MNWLRRVCAFVYAARDSVPERSNFDHGIRFGISEFEKYVLIAGRAPDSQLEVPYEDIELLIGLLGQIHQLRTRSSESTAADSLSAGESDSNGEQSSMPARPSAS